jgi:non-heme chloroperoxidase
MGASASKAVTARLRAPSGRSVQASAGDSFAPSSVLQVELGSSPPAGLDAVQVRGERGGLRRTALTATLHQVDVLVRLPDDAGELVTKTAPVVFIHGLWLHSTGWTNWLEMFESTGYEPMAPGYPGEAASVRETRSHPERMAGLGIEDLTAAYTKVIAALPAKPIVIGHSLGGLIAQKLLAQGTAAAAVAVNPGQIKGVLRIPLVQLRSGSAALRRPGNRHRAVSLTAEQFRFGFGNTLSATESQDLFDRWTIPGPGKPAFEVATSNLRRTSPAAVDTRLDERGPLLFIAGGADHIVPPAVVKAASDLYAPGRATTDHHVFPGRGHSMVLDHGWRDVAEYSLNWLNRQGF